MKLDELYVEYGHLSYWEIDQKWQSGELTYAEKTVLQENTQEYKDYKKDMEEMNNEH